jgi:hypothetical protein
MGGVSKEEEMDEMLAKSRENGMKNTEKFSKRAFKMRRMIHRRLILVSKEIIWNSY